MSKIKVKIVPVTMYQQNCSIIRCEETGMAAIVDPGGDIDLIEEALENLHAVPEKILLTHGHMDHCAAADTLRLRWEIPIEGPAEDDRFWIEGLPNWCKMAGFPIANSFEPNRWLVDGEQVTVGAQTLLVLHCPGHTPGHVVFFHTNTRLAWVGDVLFAGSIGRTDFPMGNLRQLITAIKTKLFPLGDDVTFVPGHGPNSTFGRERATNPFIRE